MSQPEIAEQFFLPFPVVAVEDKDSVVILADLQNEQRGFGHEYLYVSYCDHNRSVQKDALNVPRRELSNAGVLHHGICKPRRIVDDGNGGHRWEFDCGIHGVHYTEKNHTIGPNIGN